MESKLTQQISDKLSTSKYRELTKVEKDRELDDKNRMCSNNSNYISIEGHALCLTKLNVTAFLVRLLTVDCQLGKIAGIPADRYLIPSC